MAPNIFWSVLRQDDDVAFFPDIESSKFHNPGDSENTRIPRIVRYQKRPWYEKVSKDIRWKYPLTKYRRTDGARQY